MFVALSIVALGAGSSACATKKYVNNRVGEVNDKMTTMSSTLEETQERTRQNEQKIGEVDQRVTAVNDRAEAAGRSATDARSAADAVNTRVTDMDKSSRRLVYEVVLTDDKAKFKSGRAILSDEARGEIDQLVQQLQADPKNVWIEVEGHTDGTGSTQLNERLGMQRAEAVKLYLYEQHSIPLHKINVISYGESKPVAPNNTREGRAQNRRVEIKVVG
jgi:outer membrane protein OmpA-like peptidoglycan-associated protein